MIGDLWNTWQQNWRRMEALARRRGWEVTSLSIAPPASKAAIASAEKVIGLPFPQQLREVLTQCSAAVHFGWYIPFHLAPMELTGLPNISTGYDLVWDIKYIRDHALPELRGWTKHFAPREFSEAPDTPGTPEMGRTSFLSWSL